jgi:hypothetical protein
VAFDETGAHGIGYEIGEVAHGSARVEYSGNIVATVEHGTAAPTQAVHSAREVAEVVARKPRQRAPSVSNEKMKVVRHGHGPINGDFREPTQGARKPQSG